MESTDEIVIESVRSEAAAEAIAEPRCATCGDLEREHDDAACKAEYEA